MRFEGKALAEHLERLLFLCPKCGRMHTLQSRDDTVRCWKCGFSFRYLPTGFLVGEDIPFDNLRDWTRWQKGEIVRLCDEAAPLLPTKYPVASGSGTKLLGRGDMRLFRGTLELPKAEIPVSEITGVSLMGPQDLYISTGDTHYVIRSSTVHCMVKYLTALSHLNGDVHYGE